MKLVVAGLGRMGGQIARKLALGGHQVIAHNRSKKPIDEAVRYGAKAAYEKTSALKEFTEGKFILWLMVPADAVDQQLDEWLKILPAGSIIIDGGNSDFRLSKKRAGKVSSLGSTMVDVGTSGGIWGFKNGFCMMVGGDTSAYKTIEPVLKTLAKPAGGYAYFGESGSGHFVKMVHNAIEYGMMESLSEGYRMLKEGPYNNLDLAAAGDVWQRGSVINSWLNDITRQAVSENPLLEGIDGVVAESGEARWALEVAKQQGIPMPVIQSSFDIRVASQNGNTNFATKLLAAMRNKFGGHDINPN